MILMITKAAKLPGGQTYDNHKLIITERSGLTSLQKQQGKAFPSFVAHIKKEARKYGMSDKDKFSILLNNASLELQKLSVNGVQPQDTQGPYGLPAGALWGGRVEDIF